MSLSLLLSGSFFLGRITFNQEEPYPLAQVSLAIAKPLQSGSQIQLAQLNASDFTWSGTQLAASLWWHLRKRTWRPSGSEQLLPIPSRLLSLLSAWVCSSFPLLGFFFPQKVWGLSPAFFWYVSCSLPKHAGCMTNEVGAGLAKVTSLFLSPVAITPMTI